MSVPRELPDPPREVTESSFAVRLTEGVAHPREIIDSYAVTPDIVRNLNVALGNVQAAIRGRHSEAAHVHGSFGSGKSHFMAVLSLLLANDQTAWGDTELHDSGTKPVAVPIPSQAQRLKVPAPWVENLHRVGAA